jgi:hypothetical protein
VRAAAYHQAGGLAHGGNVGRDVDGVGGQQQRDDAVQQPGRAVAPHIGRQPCPLTRPMRALMAWMPTMSG